MAMPTTACSCERVNSKLGKTFTADRNALLVGLATAQQLVFVQTNDPMTLKERDFDVCVE